MNCQLSATSPTQHISSISTYTELRERFIHDFSALGFRFAMLTNLYEPQAGITHQSFVGNFPVKAMCHYVREEHYRSDPVQAACGRSPAPVYWWNIQAQVDRIASASSLLGCAVGSWQTGISWFVDTGRVVKFAFGGVYGGSRTELISLMDERGDSLWRLAALYTQHLMEHFMAAFVRGRKLPISEEARRVLVLLYQGYSTKEIASELDISAKTVDYHSQRAKQLMGARNKHQAAVLGWQRGYY